LFKWSYESHARKGNWVYRRYQARQGILKSEEILCFAKGPSRKQDHERANNHEFNEKSLLVNFRRRVLALYVIGLIFWRLVHALSLIAVQRDDAIYSPRTVARICSRE